MMNKLEKKLRCYTLIAIMYFTSLFGTLFMLFLYLPLLFVNRHLFHVLSDYSLHVWFGNTVWLLEKFTHIKIFLHKRIVDKQKRFNKSAIVIMNHRTRLDWLFYFCILYRLNALSNIKIILKDGLKKIPGAGWAMQTALFIFIKRKWAIDQQIFTKFINYYKQIQKRVFILIFPEGTNLTQETIAKSDKFADDNNLERYRQVLHPRVTGFIHVFNEMNKNQMIDCVHDVTIAYRGGEIPENELKFLNGKLPDEIHFYFDMFDLNEVFETIFSKEFKSKEELNSNQILENWLNNRWKSKEAFLNCFYNNDNEFKEMQSNYETERPNSENTKLLFVYPLYWLVSCIFMIYLIYTYVWVKISFLLSFTFYMTLQFIGNGLDNLIVKLNNSKNLEKS